MKRLYSGYNRYLLDNDKIYELNKMHNSKYQLYRVYFRKNDKGIIRVPLNIFFSRISKYKQFLHKEERDYVTNTRSKNL